MPSLSRVCSSVALLVLTVPASLRSQDARLCPEVDDSTRRAVQIALSAANDDAPLPLQSLCRPGIGAVALLSAKRDRPTDYGPRVALIRFGEAMPVRVASVTPGLSDSQVPDIRVFEATGRVFLLADLGDEGGSWGFATYEAVGDSLRELGLLDVGKASRDDENDQSAVNHLSVRLSAGQWEVRFDTTIVLRPNQDTRAVVPASRLRPVTFHIAAGKWRRVP